MNTVDKLTAKALSTASEDEAIAALRMARRRVAEGQTFSGDGFERELERLRQANDRFRRQYDKVVKDEMWLRAELAANHKARQSRLNEAIRHARVMTIIAASSIPIAVTIAIAIVMMR